MAKIWPVNDRNSPTSGEAWACLPLSEAVALFELQSDDYVSDLAETPRFGDSSRDLWYPGFKQIVVEVSRSETRKSKWKPGFYKSRITPEEGYIRLIRQALVTELGDENVERLETEPTTDSWGQDALKITIVIAPDTTRRFKSGAVLDALVSLKERLFELGEHRTPIIEYTTEAELEQDDGPSP